MGSVIVKMQTGALKERLFVLFFTMLLLGFFIGYDYALVQVVSNEKSQISAKDGANTSKIGETGLTDWNDDDIMNKD